jgi:hypothetical protein
LSGLRGKTANAGQNVLVQYELLLSLPEEYLICSSF